MYVVMQLDKWIHVRVGLKDDWALALLQAVS